MPESDFTAEILQTEVVVNHTEEGHVFHFPILSNGTVSLHGSRIKANPVAKREAGRYLFDAHNAARAALSRPPLEELHSVRSVRPTAKMITAKIGASGLEIVVRKDHAYGWQPNVVAAPGDLIGYQRRAEDIAHRLVQFRFVRLI